MVVPLSLDPGHNDPRSPLFTGCPDCHKRGTGGSLCPDCQSQRDMEEARAEHWEARVEERIQQRKKPYPVQEEAEAVAGEEP